MERASSPVRIVVRKDNGVIALVDALRNRSYACITGRRRRYQAGGLHGLQFRFQGAHGLRYLVYNLNATIENGFLLDSCATIL